MRLLHTSDWHIGFRQFDKLTETGQNQREADVERTCAWLVDRIIVEAPELLVIGGDLFHYARPSNAAILFATRQFQKLREQLPNTAIVIAAGNHDAPRSQDVGHILRLAELFGIHVAITGPEHYDFPEIDCAVFAVPDVIGMVHPEFVPTSTRAHNVLVMHGEIAGIIKGAEKKPHEIEPEALNAPLWSYVALGHYHVYQEVAQRAYYSGAIDYTSTNVWGEVAEERERELPGKVYITRDLTTNEHRVVPIPASRLFLENVIDCAALDVEGVDRAIALASVDNLPGDGHVARIVLRNASKTLTKALDQKALRSHRANVLNLQIISREREKLSEALAVAAPKGHATLVDRLREFLGAYELDPRINRDSLVNTGVQYLTQATDANARVAVEA